MTKNRQPATTTTTSSQSWCNKWALLWCSVVASVISFNSNVSDGFSSRKLTTRFLFTTSLTEQSCYLARGPSSNSNKAMTTTKTFPLFMSTFSSDGSEYSSKESDYDFDDVDMSRFQNMGPSGIMEDDVETIELEPVPMSKNAGNRFVALYWDHEMEQQRIQATGDPHEERDPWQLHYDRDELNEDHVMFCRKRNLYNETFNTESMVDVMRSFPM